jgi:uncharacterized protein YdhG (YjbR/CyaY superfamily)
MKKAANVPVNVDEYLDGFPEPVRITLQRVRQSIKAAAPKAEEIISYQIPTYKHMGALIHFAAFENHCSLYVVSKNILKMFEKELKSYKTSGTTIHFTPDKPLPVLLIKRIVKVRVKENEEMNALKANNKK